MACDVLVVGAGPAGSVAARAAAAAGAGVILLERRPEVGVPVRCAGYVAKTIRWHVDLLDECIVQSVDGIRTRLPDGSVQETEVPGYILNRAELDKHLARGAVEAGARLFLNTTAVDREDDSVLALQDGRNLRVRARIIIGADGPRSTVARWMVFPKSKRPRFARALQYEVELTQRLSTAEIFFRPEFRGGYAWLFPAGRVARLGAAFVSGGREAVAGLGTLLRELEAKDRVRGAVLSVTAGLVPVGGPAMLRRGSLALAGDAAGHTHPITGAGILNAIIAGEMAGKAAARAAATGCPDCLKEYEEECLLVLGPALDRARERRCQLEDDWSPSPAELAQTIRRSWITFDEYYRR